MGEAALDFEQGFRLWLPRAVAADVAVARHGYNDNVVQLREAHGVTIDDDDDQWRKLTGESKRDLSPLTQSRMQELALYVWETNVLANRLIELPLAYCLAEGVKLTAADENVQEWIDAFWDDPINCLDLKLVKKVRELALFGEQCYPTFVNEMNGHVRLGYLDPGLIETIITDPDNGEQKIGVVTVRDTKGRQRRYRIIVNGPEEALFTERTRRIRNTLQDGECFYFAVNDLSNGRRGRSDLLAAIDWLDAYDQFLFGEIERSSFMRAFIWDVTMKGATQAEVDARAKKISPPRANSVRVHNDAEEWNVESPDLKAQDASENAKLFRNHLLGGATIPEHWFGGASDVNRATGESMGEPTFKIFSMRQRFIGHILEEMGRYQIRQRELAHGAGEPDLNDPLFKLNAQFPEMVARDTTKYASALAQVTMAVSQATDRGFVSEELAVKVIESVAGRLGVEFDAVEELAKARVERDERTQADVFTEPDADDAPDDDGDVDGE